MRPREESFDINTYYKFKVINANKIPKEDTHRKEKYKILKDFVVSNIAKKELTTNAPSFTIRFLPPKYEGIKKSYATKDKPVKFHEKATIAGVEAGEITSSQKPIDFQTLMAMFDNAEEIREVDIEKFLCIDLEKMGSLKDKTSRIINFINSYDIPGEQKQKVIKYLDDKIDQFKNTQDDIENIVSNLSAIERILYGADETKFFFRK